MTTILGINVYHSDSSACLIQNGELVAAVEEERFRRIKHWAGFPSEAIRYCLTEAGLTLSGVDAVAINQDSKANLWKKLGFTLATRPNLSLVIDRLRNKKERESVGRLLARTFPDSKFKGKVYPVEHHLAHLSSAFHVSPFKEAVVVSVDGFGDFASGAWGIGRERVIVVEGRVYFPHSLGIFYQALTQYLGFHQYGDEYKVMGLAPYGEPKHLNMLRNIVRLQDDGGYRLNLDYFRHHKEKVAYEWENGAPGFGRLFSDHLTELLGPEREKGEELTQKHMDIAHSVQAMYEEAFFHLLNRLRDKYGLDAVTLSGGCAMNSVANGKVTKNTLFKRVYIQSAAGDAGGAIGAAFSVWHDFNTDKPSTNSVHSSSQLTENGSIEKKAGHFVMDHAYWGPSFSNNAIGDVLDSKNEVLEKRRCVVERIDNEYDLCRRTAQAIADGKVIGWFQGRMEWGPRSLGNRSIVCDPRRADMKDILNRKIKRRESFRPFAPSILRDYVLDWFEQDDEVPFMMKVFQIRKKKRSKIPAVTHVDGSGRLQTVYKNTNPRYYRLIDVFREQTGIPMVLNTSFNENEPVVCRPEEALDCFLRTKMDILVIGDWFCYRKVTRI